VQEVGHPHNEYNQSSTCDILTKPFFNNVDIMDKCARNNPLVVIITPHDSKTSKYVPKDVGPHA
jgi:hypothetical protein